MTPLLTKAARVIAACERMLEVCAKATAGPWSKDWGRVRDAHCDTLCVHPQTDDWEADKWKRNAAFIAQARTMTEPALRCTVIGLRALMALSRIDQETVDGLRKMGFQEAGKDLPDESRPEIALTAMLAEWPDTI